MSLTEGSIFLPEVRTNQHLVPVQSRQTGGNQRPALRVLQASSSVCPWNSVPHFLSVWQLQAEGRAGSPGGPSVPAARGLGESGALPGGQEFSPDRHRAAPTLSFPGTELRAGGSRGSAGNAASTRSRSRAAQQMFPNERKQKCSQNPRTRERTEGNGIATNSTRNTEAAGQMHPILVAPGRPELPSALIPQ